MRPLPRDPVAFLSARLRMAITAGRARFGRSSIVSTDGPVVSLTSFGARVSSVHLAIASIGHGDVRPARIVLWLDDPELVAHPPAPLRRLRRRGLEIRACDDLGPHKKYHPYVHSLDAHDRPMVTADDDVLYARHWLAALIDAHRVRPDAIVAHRVNRITVEDGVVLPYVRWGRAEDDLDTPRNYAVGVKGILYPPRFLEVLRRAGAGFTTVAPGSSDTWLHHCSLRAQVSVLPVPPAARPVIVPLRGVRRSPALLEQNVDAGRNDRVRGALWSAEDERLVVAGAWPDERDVLQ